MGFSLFIGTFLIALGPASAVFMLVVAPHANLVVVSILSAFFWVCSISLASLLWLGVPESGSGGVVELLLAVLLQEIGRYGYYRLCAAAERQVSAVTQQKLFCPNSYDSILASGLGFGVASACVMLGDTLVQSLEPGSFYAPSCTAFSFYVSSALHASLMIALNVALMVIATHGYQRRDPSWALCATGAHALGSLATTLNAQENGCVGSLLALSVVTLLSMFSAGRIVWRGLF